MVESELCPHEDDPTTCPPCNRHIDKERERVQQRRDAWSGISGQSPATIDQSTYDETHVARFASTCRLCCTTIHIGDMMRYSFDEDRWVHEECV